MDKLIPLEFKPGINQQSTRYATRIGWRAGDKVRFYDGKPESIRGWAKKTAAQFEGTARDIIAWNDLEGIKYIGFGTECRLYIYDNVSIYDVTPIRVETSASSLFNVSANSTRAVVSITAHGAASGDHVIFTSAVTVGGNVLISGEYDVSLISTNAFAIDVALSATATSASAGRADYHFLLECGASIAAAGTGWGAGGFGLDEYGTPRDSSAIILDMRQWSLDTYGEDLLACPRGGGIYKWHVSAGTAVRAALVTAAPSINNFIIVSPEDRHVISFGTTDQVTGVYDPLLIRWSDTEDIDDWTAAVTNTAGSQRINGANKIIGAVRSRGQILVWTDDTLHGMAFSGAPYVFSLRQLGTQCGLFGPHAAIDYNGRSFWMSNNSFYRYDGRVQQLDCTVLRYVFDDFNLTQKEKTFAGTNAEFSEITWLYCSRNSNEIDRYVTLNTRDESWCVGTINWSTWFDKSVYDNVITTGTDSHLYDNEVIGKYTADGVAMRTCIETGDFDLPGISENDFILLIDRIIPDFTMVGNSPNVDLFFVTKNYPGGPEVEKGPFNITQGTTYISPRLRGRTARMRIVTSADGGWRLGIPRFRVTPDGKR